MLTAAIFLFCWAAVFGLIILTAVLRDKPTPKPVVFIHGLIAASALTLVLIYIYNDHREPLLLVSAAVFIIAALGGATLLSFDLFKGKVPKKLALLHPALAACALILLIIYACM